MRLRQCVRDVCASRRDKQVNVYRFDNKEKVAKLSHFSVAPMESAAESAPKRDDEKKGEAVCCLGRWRDEIEREVILASKSKVA